jgi:hypothetical protein
MGMSWKFIIFSLSLTGMVIVLSPDASGQSDISHKGTGAIKTIILPQVYKPLNTRTSVSVLFTQLPFDWIETSVEVPLFQVNNKLGLPAGFSLESNFQTILISNQIRSGLHWNYQSGKTSISAGIDEAFLFGKMKIAGFNNKSWGWCSSPVIATGYRTDRACFTAIAEYTFISSIKITSGSAETLDEKNLLSGYTLSLYVEQPLWKNHVIILGLINNIQKVYYPAWPTFTSFNRRYYIPQFHAGLIL